jgi:peptide/nickel transport system permease protein
MTTTGSLPGMTAASPQGVSIRASILTAWRKSRLMVRGIPTFSLLILGVTMLCALLAPVLAPYDPIKTNPARALVAPSFSDHLLGTDHLGRDILSRLIYGARISVTVGFLAVFVAGTAGTAIALISAVCGGAVDRVLMQITDAFLALPYLMIAVTVISMLQPSLMVVILVIGLLRWMDYARVLRGEVLRLAATDFVHLAIVAGCGRRRIMVRHILPNLVNTLLVLATLGVGSAVIAEATLSFLGLGIPRPQPSWGVMLAESQKYLYAAWWLPLIPGMAISLLVMASNLVGDWLRDHLDPTRRQL